MLLTDKIRIILRKSTNLLHFSLQLIKFVLYRLNTNITFTIIIAATSIINIVKTIQRSEIIELNNNRKNKKPPKKNSLLFSMKFESVYFIFNEILIYLSEIIYCLIFTVG